MQTEILMRHPCEHIKCGVFRKSHPDTTGPSPVKTCTVMKPIYSRSSIHCPFKWNKDNLTLKCRQDRVVHKSLADSTASVDKQENLFQIKPPQNFGSLKFYGIVLFGRNFPKIFFLFLFWGFKNGSLSSVRT